MASLNGAPPYLSARIRRGSGRSNDKSASGRSMPFPDGRATFELITIADELRCRWRRI